MDIEVLRPRLTLDCVVFAYTNPPKADLLVESHGVDVLVYNIHDDLHVIISCPIAGLLDEPSSETQASCVLADEKSCHHDRVLSISAATRQVNPGPDCGLMAMYTGDNGDMAHYNPVMKGNPCFGNSVRIKESSCRRGALDGISISAVDIRQSLDQRWNVTIRARANFCASHIGMIDFVFLFACFE